MKMRKLLVTGALSLSLAFSSFVFPAYAVSFEDTVGIGSEMAIAKIVSLGLLPSPGNNFNPEQPISRADFANLTKQLTGADVSKGSKTVTYAELSKVLANGLGLKSSWTNRPIDYLYYLDRKGVLDIDTDLDAVVTREAAAVAFDKYLSLKNSFKTVSGVVVGVSSTGISVNTDDGRIAYPFAKNISPFINEQIVDPTTITLGTPVDLTLNKQGQIAFLSGKLLDAEEGSLKLEAGKLKIRDTITKDLNFNVYLAPLPSKPNKSFTLAEFGQYQNKGISFAGTAFFADNDEVTIIYPYIAKINGATISFTTTGIVAELGEGFNLAFELSDELKVKIDETDSDLEGLKAYKRAGHVYKATIELNSNEVITSISVTSQK